MAITGTFLANFDSFVNETKRAEQSLQSLERESDKVVASMEDVGDSLSGQELTKGLGDIATASKEVIDVTDLSKLSLEQLDAVAAGTATVVGEVATAEEAATVATATWGATLTGMVGTVAGVVAAMAPYILAIGAVVKGLEYLIQKQGEAALKAEETAARQDVINKAIAEGAPKTVGYGDAVKYVNEQFQHQQELIPEVALRNWNAQIAEATRKGYEHAEEERVRTEALANAGIVLGDGLDVQKLWADAVQKGKEASKQAATEHAKLVESLNRLGATLPGLHQQIGLHVTDLEQVRAKTKAFDEAQRDLNRRLDDAQGHSRPVVLGLHDIGEAVPTEQIRDFVSGVMKVGPELEHARDGARDADTGFRDLAQAFAQLAQISGGSFGGFVQDIGAMVGAVNLAIGGIDKMKDHVNDLGVTIKAMTADSIAGFLSLAMAMYSVGRSVQAFVDALLPGQGWYAGFDQATAALNRLGSQFTSSAEAQATIREALAQTGLTAEQVERELQNLWNAFANGPEAGLAELAKIQDALDHLAAIKTGAAQFGPTKAQAYEAERFAHDVLDYMLQLQAQGQVTQEQVNKAYYAWQKALADAGNEAAKAWVAAHDGVTKALSGVSQELLNEKKRLEDAIAIEAPEPDMGLIEKAQREQLQAINDQIAAQQAASQAQAEAQAASADTAASDTAEIWKKYSNDWNAYLAERTIETSSNVSGSFQETADQFQRDFHAATDSAVGYVSDRFKGVEIRIPVHFDLDALPAKPMAAGGFGTVTKPTLFLAGEAGPEQYAFSGAHRRFAGSSPTGSGGVTVQALNVTVVASAGDDLDVLERKFTEMLRTRARAYDAVRAVAGA